MKIKTKLLFSPFHVDQEYLDIPTSMGLKNMKFYIDSDLKSRIGGTINDGKDN